MLKSGQAMRGFALLALLLGAGPTLVARGEEALSQRLCDLLAPDHRPLIRAVAAFVRERGYAVVSDSDISLVYSLRDERAPTLEYQFEVLIPTTDRGTRRFVGFADRCSIIEMFDYGNSPASVPLVRQ